MSNNAGNIKRKFFGKVAKKQILKMDLDNSER